jgi:choline dehydrogenase-like flavoprotein
MVRSLEKEFLALGINLENAFVETEKELGVTPLADNKIVKGSKAILNAAQKLGYQMQPMPKAYNPETNCDLCGNCFLGCHQGAKWDARSYINQAIENGVTLIDSIKVERVLFSGNKVRGVEITDKKEIECGLVILAAGGLGTPVILQKSDVSAGNGLFIDAFEITYGIAHDLSQLKGSLMAAIDTEFLDKFGFVLSPFVDHWSQMPIFCGLWWNLIHGFPRSRILGLMTKITDSRSGKIEPNGKISKDLTEQDRLKLGQGANISRKILLEAGVDPASVITTTKRARGAHPGGTAAVGEVVDNDLQVIGTDGLYVCDSSVFPATPGLPPILTIVALAKCLVKRLLP